MKLPTILKNLTDAIFPPKCLKCGRFLTAEDSCHIGSSAEIEILRSALNNPFDQFSKYFCADCLKPQEGVDSSYSASDSLSQQDYNLSQQNHQINVQAASLYDGVVKESIHLLKYNGKTALANPLGLLLFHTFIRHYDNKPVDFIVPIPLYRWRMVKRGFNQSFLLIRNFSHYWLQWKGTSPEWQIMPEILVRRRNTKSQTGFNRQERRDNIRGAFAVKKRYALNGKLIGKHVVIVDDVHTTGATTNEAAKMLIESGASSVGVIVAARA
ncbi:MAG: ComF family protein [Desulfamplus sp.]|nr:ComF family protein [Desulfamplus sp.]